MSFKQKTLIVAATFKEIEPFAKKSGVTEASNIYRSATPIPDTDFDILITGAGIAATATFLTKALSDNLYSAAINIGIAGSYNINLKPGTLLKVAKDRFSDLGAESENGFIPGEDIPFIQMNKSPFRKGWLIPEEHFTYKDFKIDNCTAVTSDTIHTDLKSISEIKDLYNPDIETMEGAAFFFCCIAFKIPCLQLRSISNFVGSRTKENRHFEIAIENLNHYLISFIDE